MTEIASLEMKLVIDDKKGIIPGSCTIKAKDERTRWHLLLFGHWILSETAKQMGIVNPESKEFKLGD